MKSAVATLLLFPALATAGELIIHVGSWHGDRTYNTGEYVRDGYDWDRYYQTGELLQKWKPVERSINNVNPGLGYSFDSGWAVGIYRNSYYKTSIYLAHNWTRPFGPPILGGRSAEVGFTLAAVTGYQSRFGRVLQPTAALTAGVPLTESATLRFIGGPGYGSTSPIVHLFVSYRLGQR